MHEFDLHEFFHSPKNVHLKALLYIRAFKWYSNFFVAYFILDIFYVKVKLCIRKKNQRSSRVVESGNWCTKVLLFCCKSQEQNKKVFFFERGWDGVKIAAIRGTIVCSCSTANERQKNNKNAVLNMWRNFFVTNIDCTAPFFTLAKVDVVKFWHVCHLIFCQQCLSHSFDES